MRIYEYKYLEFADTVVMINVMNELGQEGWKAIYHWIMRGAQEKHCVLMMRTYRRE